MGYMWLEEHGLINDGKEREDNNSGAPDTIQRDPATVSKS